MDIACMRSQEVVRKLKKAYAGGQQPFQQVTMEYSSKRRPQLLVVWSCLVKATAGRSGAQAAE